MKQHLRVNELFYSLQGEADNSGAPTVFVRLSGCPLRCGYCDTAYAFHQGSLMDLDTLEKKISAYQCDAITLTGGEPLAQPLALSLLNRLCNRYNHVSLETSGALCIKQVDPRVRIVLDLKTPGSGEVTKNMWSNLNHLKATDQIKFVLTDYQDFMWAKDQCLQKLHAFKGTIFFSPCYETLTPKTLANWILEHRLPVRLQIQLHKLLWGDQQGV
jgi:7-carboxy-7-deazaguanine synthase